VNNINPGTNTPNKDNADDGVILPINLPTVGCGNVQFQYIVKVVGPLKPRYVNIWFDFNQDGDWQDVIPCLGSGTALVAREWAVQNQMFNNGPGFYTILTPVFVGFRRTIGPPGMWMRITLTDTPVALAQGADGSGPVGGYAYGETEDYLLQLPRVAKPVEITPVEITPGLGTGAEICVSKFHDLNGNGVQDPGEPGLPGWTFTVTPGGPTIITGSQGTLCFGVPAPATYTVSEVVLPGWTPTTPNPQTVTASPSQLVNLSFGNKKDDKKCDLTIEKTVDPPQPISGQQAAFVIRVRNVGSGLCAPTTTVTDTLSSGVTFVSMNPNAADGWACFGTTSTTCTNPTLTLQPNQTSMVVIILVNVTAPPGTSVKNCAGVKHPQDTNPANNEICIGVPVAPPVEKCDLEMRKTGDPPQPISGQQVFFNITMKNVGTGPCRLDTVVQDPRPAGLTFTAAPVANQPGWACSLLGGNASCVTAGTLPPGYTATFTSTATVTAPPGGTITNCATVSNPADINPANNQSCMTIQVQRGVGPPRPSEPKGVRPPLPPRPPLGR
jgi:uncharacterized repeat protein (TIGR01451 family)